MRHTLDGPGPSLTDHAASAAFYAIDETLAAGDVETEQTFSLVMITIPDGRAENATVASHLPGGDVDPLSMLRYALTMLQPLAAECGVTITANLGAATN